MSYLANIISTLPWPVLDIVMNIVAGLGAVMLTYGIFLEAERHQDGVFVVASACLLAYAIWIGNKIFSLAMGGLLVGSLIEFVEILSNQHRHSEELVEKYKNPKG